MLFRSSSNTTYSPANLVTKSGRQVSKIVVKFADKMVFNPDKILIEAGPEFLVCIALSLLNHCPGSFLTPSIACAGFGCH